MAGDARRLRAEDRAAAPALHRRRPARLRADGPALLSELSDRIRGGYAAFNRGDFDAAAEGLHPEMEWVPMDMLPDAGPYRGPAGVRRFWEEWGETFDDFHAEPVEYAEGGESVVVITKVQGRGKDSGAPVETPGFPMAWTIRDGLVVRVEMFRTRAEALESVGLSPDTPFRPF